MRSTHPTLCETHIPAESPCGNIGDDTRERIVSARLYPPLAPRHGVSLCGLSDARTGFYFVRRRFAFWHVLAVTGGAGEVWNSEQGDWERAEAGTVYVSPPDAAQGYRAVTSEPWHVAWAHLAAGAVAAGAAQSFSLFADTEPFAAAVGGLYTELQERTADALMLENWAALVRGNATRFCARATSTASGQTSGDPRLARLFARVAADLAHPWTLAELSVSAAMSGEHLRRLCRLEGMDSPLRRVTELRLTHAASLLASGYYTVEKAAARVGYGNAFAFSVAFKRRFGVAPSAFRSLGH